jgi:hypothetical protein
MAEPTQGNPTPPNNQDGLISPSPDANKALDKFFAEIEDLKKLVEKSNETLAKRKKIEDKLLEVSVKLHKADEQKKKDSDALLAAHKKYIDAQGNWVKGAEAIREKYENDLLKINEGYSAAVEEIDGVTTALEENIKTMKEEKDARMSALFSLRDLRDVVKEADASIGADLSKSLGQATKYITSTNAKIETETQKISSELKTKTESVFGEMAQSLKEANLAKAAEDAAKALEEAAQKAAETAEKEKKASEEAATAAADELDEKKKKKESIKEYQRTQTAEDFGKSLEAQGGLVGLGTIKNQIDEIAKAEDDRFKAYNPKATKEEVAVNREKFIMTQKDVIMKRIEIQQQKELEKVRQERIKKIVEEKKVSVATAAKLADTKENRETDAKIIDGQSQVIKSLERLEGHEIRMIDRMEKDSIATAEREAETLNDTPPWAQKFVDGIESLKGTMGGMFKKEDGWFKTILVILTITIGAVLGYIFYKVMFIVNIVKNILSVLTHLPFGIGKVIGNVFGKLGAIGGGIGKVLAGVGSKLGLFGEGIAKVFPFLGRLGSAFKFGFQVLGKVFFYVQLVIDAIFGAYKGFQKLGNIKGLIMGAIAQIISGLTFGLLDFQSIFDFFNTTMGGVFDGIAGVFEPIVEFFGKVYDKLADAFSRVMAVFQGEGSIFSKIFKVIQIGITTTVKSIVAFVEAAIKTVFNAVVVLPFKIGNFIGEMLVKLAELTYDAFMSLWDWISSGEILADVANFGTWLYDELIDFFAGIINAIADGLGEIPIVGGYIKEALGGGAGGNGLQVAVEKSAEVVKEAQQSTSTMAATTTSPAKATDFSNTSPTPIVTPSGKVQFAPMAAPSYNANTVNNATTTTSTAKMNAMNQGGTAVINTPTTNNVVSGGGGESNVLMPTNNRNTEPTFRALLFQDCPAL